MEQDFGALSLSDKIGYVYDTRLLLHDDAPVDEFEEEPLRAEKINERILGLGIDFLRPTFDPIDPEILKLVHSESHVERVLDLALDYSDFFNPKPRGPGVKKQFGPSTYDNEHTSMWIQLSASGVVEAANAVCEGRINRAFCNTRPPGHHAGTASAGGFCFVNNVAVAAKHVQKKYGLKKVAIFDWDVHFGNGTQEILKNDDSILYISIHRYDEGTFYPNKDEGHCTHFGSGGGQGFTVNVSWDTGVPFTDPACIGSGDYKAAFDSIVYPVLNQFKPDILFISAGYDQLQGDPLGKLEVEPIALFYMTEKCQEICSKVVAVLEGGYNIENLQAGAETTVRAMMNQTPPFASCGVPVVAEWSPETTEVGQNNIEAAMKAAVEFWEIPNLKQNMAHNIENELSSLTVNTLKEYCIKLHLQLTGKKSILIQRLTAYLMSMPGKEKALASLPPNILPRLWKQDLIKPNIHNGTSEVQQNGIKWIWTSGGGGLIKCGKCGTKQHILWMGSFATLDRYECPECQMKQMSPTVEAMYTLLPPVLVTAKCPPLSRTTTREFIYTQDQESTVIKGQGRILVQLRCLCLQETPYTQQWPNAGCLELNGRSIKEFTQSANPNAKKRKDDFLNIQSMLKVGQDMINLVKSDDERAYVYGVFLVRLRDADEVINEVMNGPWLSYEEGLRKMLDRFTQTEDIVSESIKISVKWPYSMSILQTPVRGIDCQHPQCFDLEQFIRLQSISKVNRWRCPICKGFAFVLKRDLYFERIQESAQSTDDPTYVDIKPNGAYQIIKWKDEKEGSRTEPVIQPIADLHNNFEETKQIPADIEEERVWLEEHRSLDEIDTPEKKIQFTPGSDKTCPIELD